MGRRRKYKNYDDPPYVRLARDVLFECKEWRGLSSAAKLLYIHIKAKYNGSNDGKIRITYAEMKGSRGLSSPRTISKAQKELEENEWIIKTEHGGLYRHYNLFKLTWKYDGLA